MAASLIKNLQSLKCFTRRFTSCLCNLSPPLGGNLQNYSTIPVWSERVNNFGKLMIFSETIGLNVVASLSWNGERSLVAVSLVSDLDDILVSKETLRELRDFFNCSITTIKEDELSHVTIRTVGNKILQSSLTTLLDKIKLRIEIPQSYSLFLNSCSSSRVIVEKLEGNEIEVETEGDCHLSHIKSQLINVSSVSGDIICKTSLIADMVLKTSKDGCVSLGKIQGNNLKISCENGDVRIVSLYGGDVFINTQAGNVDIGDTHGNIQVGSNSGDVKCGSISGLLNIATHDGNIETKLTSKGNVMANSSNGNATIKLDDDLKCKLDMSCKTINIASDIYIDNKSQQLADDLITLTGQTRGTCEHYVKVDCHNGHVDLLKESWFVCPEN